MFETLLKQHRHHIGQLDKLTEAFASSLLLSFLALFEEVLGALELRLDYTSCQSFIF